MVVVSRWLCCVTHGCGITVIALNQTNLYLPGVVVVVWLWWCGGAVVWWCGFLTDNNTILRLHWVTLGCGNDNHL